MRNIILAIVALIAVSSSLGAQGVQYSTSSRVTWSHDNGPTPSAAQSFTFRLYTDGSTNPIIIAGTVCVAPTSTDSTGAVWSLGNGSYPNIPIFRNGVQAAGAFGAKLVTNLGVVFIQGDDLGWYRWGGAAFAPITPTDPNPATLQAAWVGRWSCGATFSAQLAVTLNVLGDHNLRLRIYDPMSMVESPDSNPVIVTSKALSAPAALKVIP